MLCQACLCIHIWVTKEKHMQHNDGDTSNPAQDVAEPILWDSKTISPVFGQFRFCCSVHWNESQVNKSVRRALWPQCDTGISVPVIPSILREDQKHCHLAAKLNKTLFLFSMVKPLCKCWKYKNGIHKLQFILPHRGHSIVLQTIYYGVYNQRVRCKIKWDRLEQCTEISRCAPILESTYPAI